MHFILAPGNLAKFDNIRKAYEIEKHVDLNAKPSLIGTPIFFGGTDVISRNKQVSFLEKVNAILKIHLLNEEDIKTPQQRQVYLIAARFMVAACLYVQSQINGSKRNSALYRIIEDNLGISPENFLDDEDKETCYLTAGRLISTPSAFEHSNMTLQKKGIAPFTEKEWEQFSTFLKEMCHKKEIKDPSANFPIISLTQPLFGTAFSYVGATVGVVLAEGVSNSTSAISPRVQLTALVGSTLLVFSPAGTTGVALFAPVIATKLLTSFCTISLAHVMGKAAGYLGQGVGIGVGLPFDLAYNLLWSVCSLIARYYSKAPQFAVMDGIRIVDGATIIAGIPIQLVPENALPTGCTKKTLEITEEGEVRIEGEEVQDLPMQIPPEVLEELNKQIVLYTPNKGGTEIKQSENKEPIITEPDEVEGLSLI
ncbi:hypothetical protein [Legionella longbeachae]|uniref:Substrate of the Dot/Icm secretion system n=1 Tax=Legionella longbeachae serogroup 1 (strain NSW150) TaxID=661367 RepID=D3HQW1_LEGLN|nr:hypothetical protein [Legionella longbeachae]VEE01796.1 Dot/Icm secretion system substrate [Legionella oakridgensis]HBD7396547.1 hypothetical protein [Legionella pneumophila]ARB91879.1 hypothetical protein A6J40_06670 [Legionella longbeachae]ARM34934.1 hypothetical protein B0B39_16055 [Legionella longbeachae]EEZ95604.1 conserved hypothetical protein [Legionella longbeachae D-4968]